MSLWVLISVILHVFMGLALAVVWIRQTRPAKEDPRLSRGLQLLQSKIAVLEDLSDRTENQVQQLVQILEDKTKNIQNKMFQAQDTIRQIENAMHKSLNVAEIFQDKIPHEEIIQRNQQTKYITAAKMANEGKTVEEIIQETELPRSEVEFIAKVNRDSLTFDPQLLPEWARVKTFKNEIEAKMVEKVFQGETPDLSSLQKIEREFKQTVEQADRQEREVVERQRRVEEKAQQLKTAATQLTQNIVQKVSFPRITVDRSKLPITIPD